MRVNTIKRPWQKDEQRRYNRDPFYQSSTWKKVKQSFKLGTTEYNGKQVSNTLCFECYKEGKIREGHSIDHIVRIKDGGSRTDHSNLMMLCESHHAQKSAREAQL